MVDSVSGAVVQAGNRTFITGQGSGLNFTSLIQAAYDQKVRAADRLDVKIETNQSKIQSYNELRTLTSNLRNSVADLRRSYDILNQDTNLFAARTASIESSGSSNPFSFVDISIEGNAALADYDLEVVSLGRAQKVVSDGANGLFVSKTAAANKGSATFELGLVGGPTSTVSFDNNSSLQDIVNQINASSSTTNVRASIVSLDGGANYQFILEAQDSGADFQFIDTSGDDGFELLGITDAGNAYLNEIEAATPSQIRFEGILLTPQNSNDYNSLIEGVNITLKKETAGEIINIDVENDVAAVKQGIEGFIESYNALRDFIIQNQQVNSDGTVPEDAVLFGENILQSLSSQIQGILSRNFTTDAGFSTLRNIGIQLDSNNRLSIANPTTFDNALLNNFDSVRQLFETQIDIDSENLRVTVNRSVQQDYNFTLDITHDGSQITGVSVGGDNSLFTINGSSIVGNAGTIYEGLTLAYVGTVSDSINVQINSGYADLLSETTRRFDDIVTGSIQQEILRLETSNTDLSLEADEIRDRAEKFRDREIDRLALLEARIAQAQITIDQIKAVVNAGRDD